MKDKRYNDFRIIEEVFPFPCVYIEVFRGNWHHRQMFSVDVLYAISQGLPKYHANYFLTGAITIMQKEIIKKGETNG